MKRGLQNLNHGGATKKGKIYKTIFIPKGSELHKICFGEHGEKRPAEERKKLLEDASEYVKQIARAKGLLK